MTRQVDMSIWIGKILNKTPSLDEELEVIMAAVRRISLSKDKSLVHYKFSSL